MVRNFPDPVEAQAEILGQSRGQGSLRELVHRSPPRAKLSEELHCLAGAVYFGSRGEPLDGQLAVAQVIVNRAEDRRFPSSYCGVVFQRSQFSFVKGGSMPHPHWLGRMEACEGYRADRASWPVGQPGKRRALFPRELRPTQVEPAQGRPRDDRHARLLPLSPD